jgi:hypothetical protein
MYNAKIWNSQMLLSDSTWPLILPLQLGNTKMIASLSKNGKGFGISTMAQHGPYTSNRSGPTSSNKSNYSRKVKQERDASSRGRCSNLATPLHASII